MIINVYRDIGGLENMLWKNLSYFRNIYRLVLNTLLII